MGFTAVRMECMDFAGAIALTKPLIQLQSQYLQMYLYVSG